jgi:hypothetical protein
VPAGFYNDVTRELVKLIVPRNLNSRHTANAILKQAGSESRL